MISNKEKNYVSAVVYAHNNEKILRILSIKLTMF